MAARAMTREDWVDWYMASGLTHEDAEVSVDMRSAEWCGFGRASVGAELEDQLAIMHVQLGGDE